jgi:hypothetical protein
VLGVQADELQQVLHGLLHAVLGGHLLQLERRADDRTHGVPRVERRVRVLEDHLYVPAQWAHCRLRHMGDVPALEDDLARGRLEQTGEQPARGRLATAGLADQGERLALLHREIQPVHGLHVALDALQQALADGEVLLQSGGFQQGLGGLLGGRCGQFTHQLTTSA